MLVCFSFSDFALFAENQSSVEQLSSNTFNEDLDNASSVGEYKKHSKALNSPFPICGHVTKRKKQEMPCNPIMPTDFDTKIDQEITLHCSTGTVSTTNEICNEMAPKVISQIESCSQPGNEPSHTGQVSFSNNQKSEETVYDTDMELTASELGEILIIKSKGREKNANIASKKSSDLREMKYSNTEKQIKDNLKMKKCNKNIPKNGKVKKTRTIGCKKSLSPKKQLSQRKTFRGEKLKNTSQYNFGKDFRSSNKNNRQMHLINLENQQQTTRIVQTEKVKDTISETVQNSDNQAPKHDITASSSEDSSKGCCIESLPLIERDISHVMLTNQHAYANTETFPVASKNNQANHQIKQDKKTNVKNKYNSKDNICNYNITEKSTYVVDVPKGGQSNAESCHKELSQSDKRRIFAKASRKTCIIYPNSHNRRKTFVKQELQDENIPPTDTHMTTENKQNVQNVRVSCSQRETELCDEIFFQKISYISKPKRKTYVVSSCDQNKSTENAISKSIEATSGFCKVPENIPVLNPKVLQRHCQEKKGHASIQKGDIVCNELHHKTPIIDSGMYALNLSGYGAIHFQQKPGHNP